VTLPADPFAGPGRVELCGAPPGHDARALAEIAAQNRRTMVLVLRNDVRLDETRQALGFFAPGQKLSVIPAWDCLPYDRVSPKTEIVARRMEALVGLSHGGAAPVLVLTTVNAVLQRLPPRTMLAAATSPIRVGERLDGEKLAATLGRTGYRRVGTVMEPGEFAVRGGLIDLFPPGGDEPYRIDLFGDMVEALRRFDPLSQRTTAQVRELMLMPVSEFMMDAESVQRFRAGYREAFGAVNDDDPLYQAISAGQMHLGMEHWLPLFHERLDTLFDYLPGAPVILDHGAEEAADERLAAIHDAFAARSIAPKGAGAMQAAPYKPLPPERLYLGADEWRGLLAARPVGQLRPFGPPPGQATTVDLGGRPGRNFSAERAQQGGMVFDAMGAHFAERRKSGRRTLLTAFTPGARERLALVLRDHRVGECSEVASFDDLRARPATVTGLGVLALEQGFDSPDLSVVSEQDLLGERLARPRRQRRAEDFLADAALLSAGDLVVHIEHGIGRFEGLHTIDAAGAPHDCLLITYDAGDRLYVPVENIEVLSRYGTDTGTVALDRLGGAGWQGRKARMKQRLKDMAEELIRVAALRSVQRAEALQPPPGLFEEFCARFPYEETADQSNAIADTLADLAGGHPMDRLVCGDVGFGKTEVALRAAFVVTMAGKQVAVVCPTTLLARQHHATFSQRFKGLPLRVGQLSRLTGAADAALVKEGLAKGTMDIVIGTHAVLGKNVAFERLGMVIVDEEQHFGVRHKERLKQLEANVHVLTLTATPIPRTLQLALSGVRDLSLISTPPVDRLAVRTFVLPFDPVVVREAMMREHARKGQIFYVCPRIEDLPDAQAFMRDYVPELSTAVAHGQMPAKTLEHAMTEFYEGRREVLICTNIIESGLDIPTANTLVVHRADMFGLSQLYQLRGRIGRSKARAYAYFTLPARKKISAGAEKRLHVLEALDTLGAGFSLASHDLDIRGAGNLLGEEQSGHIREVGYELYQEMLNEAIAAARDTSRHMAAEKWSPQISLGTAVLIPETYVADLDLRLQLYRRIARLEERADIDGFAGELADRFGPLPTEVRHLLDVVAIKKLCRDAGVARIEAGPRGATLAFRDNRFANPGALVAFISRRAATAKLRPDHRLVFQADWPDGPARIRGVMELAGAIAEIALSVSPEKAPQPRAAAPSVPASASASASPAKRAKT
jgi:transcription-repair coupling factor (superfamily II helicase)